VQLTFLGKVSESGESPTLYATDRDSYIVQGFIVSDDDLLADLALPAGETVVEVYPRLFDYLANDGVNGTVSRCERPVVHIRQNGNCLVQGVRLPAPAVRSQMAIPGHEDAVEVPKVAMVALTEGLTCN